MPEGYKDTTDSIEGVWYTQISQSLLAISVLVDANVPKQDAQKMVQVAMQMVSSQLDI